MKQSALVAGVVALGLTLSSCQVFGQSGPTEESPTPAASETAIGLDVATVTAEVSPTPEVLVTPTPAATPTPGTPTATPTATPTPLPPSSALAPAVSGLEQKLSAFRSALATKNLDRLSSAQLALLDEADKAELSLKDDKSRQADLVRAAIDDIRSGAAGQPRLLDAAAQGLSQAKGSTGSRTPLGTVTAFGRSTSSDLPTLANSLREKLAGYDQAQRERNSENLLRRQKDLVDVLAEVQEATKDDSSPEAKQLRDAAAGVRRALDGTSGEAGSALAQAREAIGAAGSDQSGQTPADPAAAAEPVQRKATAFKAALDSGSGGELARLQRELLDEIGRAEDSLKDDSSPAAEKVRAALSGLRDGAGGDAAKLDGALNTLAEATGSASPSSPARPGTAPTDLKKTAETLDGKVSALREAIQKGNSSEQLRLQRELYDIVARTKPGLEGDPSSQAGAMRAALDAVGNGISGDQQKLSEASKQLAQVLGKSATPVAATLARRQSGQSAADVGPIKTGLDGRLSTLEEALRRGDADAVDKAAEDLRAEADKAAEAVQRLDPTSARAARAAITSAREAAGGDLSKVQAAREALKELGR